MSVLKIGDKVLVRYQDGELPYLLDVAVTEVFSFNDFAGRIEAIYSCWGDLGEVTAGEIVQKLKAEPIKLKNADVM
jgi:hypothetical protein